MVTTGGVWFCTSWDYLFIMFFAQKESESEKKHLSLQDYIIVVSFRSDSSKFSRAFFSDLREFEPKVVIIYNAEILFDNPLITLVDERYISSIPIHDIGIQERNI